MKSVDVAILGVSGTLGQEYVKLLSRHPFFRIRSVTGYTTVGKTLREVLEEDVPESIGDLEIQPTQPKKVDADIVFSPLPNDVARKTEEEFAEAGFTVVTDASPHRMDPDIPLIIPEVNPEQLSLLESQRKRGWDGVIVATPNCTAVGVAITLKPLEPFGIKSVVATTMQALSGAGYPGVPSLDITDNLIPYISGEEEKVASETNKILGRQAQPIHFAVTATRVPVIDGHTVSMHVELEENVSPEDVGEEMSNFSGRPQELRLPTAPEKPIILLRHTNRPQPRLDRNAGSVPGMSVSVGRIRRGLSDRSVQYVHVSNNVIRG
ncbi:aspartate-semialdehyde dehydrogenase, partial [Candidatus Marsarchaeota G2 archaeon BE_D]